jgi:hypothetical protein
MEPNGFEGRIACERDFPQRCFVYAGGFDECGRLNVSEDRLLHLPPQGRDDSGCDDFGGFTGSRPNSTALRGLDGTKKYAVHVWSPTLRCWNEISVLGYGVTSSFEL